MKKYDENNKLKIKLYIRVLILIILVLLVLLTSFRTGRKFYLLKNTFFDNTIGNVESGVARWNFDARIVDVKEDTNE